MKDRFPADTTPPFGGDPVADGDAKLCVCECGHTRDVHGGASGCRMLISALGNNATWCACIGFRIRVERPDEGEA